MSQVQLNLSPGGVEAPRGVEQISMSDLPGGDDTRACSVKGCCKPSRVRRSGEGFPTYDGPVFTGLPRFDCKVKESTVNFHNGTPCWEWQASLRHGYGNFYTNGRVLGTHRIAYEAIMGSIPEGLHLDHLCRNRACCNPAHLEPVTPEVNFMRSPLWNGNKTHCPHGHEYTPENTYLLAPRKERFCRECHRERNRVLSAKRRLLKRSGPL